MKKRVFFATLMLLIVASCNTMTEEDDCELIEIAQVVESYEQSPNGYLRFSNSDMLEQYMDSCCNGNSEETSISLSKKICSGGFVSIADLSKRYEHKKYAISKACVGESDDDDEEMSVDEYNLMKTESLLFDNNLTYVLDTTLRICVEGVLYKITPYGTFAAKEDEAINIEQAISNFDTTLLYTTEIGETVTLPNGVEFMRSFKNAEEIANEDDIVEDHSLSKNFATNAFHTGYNVDSYLWKNHSMFQKFLDKLRGKKVSREKKFSKNKRVQVIVFEVDYKFYRSTGIKVKVQKRKKFCGIPYWKETSADKVAIGFNGLDGEFTHNNPRNYSSIVPTTSSAWGKFTATINKIPRNFIYGKISNVDFLRDWINNGIYCILPEINVKNTNYTNVLVNELYDAELKEISDLPKRIINKYVFNPIKTQIKPKDPIISYLFWGSTSTTYNKERPYVTGVEEYNRGSKSMVFDRSFGITVKISKSVSGFCPTKFSIKKIDAFGAAYCDGQWMGVRFYYE